MLEVLIGGLVLALMGTIAFIQEAIDNRKMVKWAKGLGYIAILLGAVVNVVLCVGAMEIVTEVVKVVPRDSIYEVGVCAVGVVGLGSLAFLIGMLATGTLAKRLFVRYAPQE